MCFVLSLAYSVPPLRLKAVAGADWIINMWGFGTLTPLAGWTATGLPIDLARWLVLLAFCPLFAALYPLTQLYQLEEDTRRGDRTLACVLGVRRSLDAAVAAAVLAFALFAAAGDSRRLAGRRDGPLALGRARPGARGVGLGADPVAAAITRGWRRPTTSGACTGRSAPGPSPTWSSCWRGAPDRPLAGPAAAAYTSTPPHPPGDGMHSAVELRADHDLTDVPAIVRGSVKLGLLESVIVLVISLVSRFLPNGVLQTAVLAVIVIAGLFAVTFLPGLWTRPRTIEGIAGAAGIGLGAAVVYLLHRRRRCCRTSARTGTAGWSSAAAATGGITRSGGWSAPSCRGSGAWMLANQLVKGQRRVARRGVRPGARLRCRASPSSATVAHFPGAAWNLGTFGVAFLPGLALATVLSGLGAKRA